MREIAFLVPSAATWHGVVGSVWEQGEVPGTLDGDGQTTLVSRTGARLPSGLDLPAFGDVAAQLERVLVVNTVDLVHAERADFLASAAAATEAAATTTTAAAWAEGPITPISAAAAVASE